MSFDSKKIEFSRHRIRIVELDLDYCALTHGTAPCTATETGDDKCFNTSESTNDLPNFDQTTLTYRFCEPVSPHPIGLDAIPSITSISISAAKIDIKGGLGVRANVNVGFKDDPSSDIGIDKYIADRTYNPLDRGSFWTKLRARNPNYQFREMRVLTGYLEIDGSYDAANFTTRYYVIDSIDVSNGTARVVGKDPLKLASNKKAQAPAPSTGQLSALLAAATTTATLIPAGVGNLEYPANGKVLIGSEVISFSRIADALTLTRAQNNTVDVQHAANDTVQLCLEYNDQVNIIAKDLMVTYAGIDASFIPDATWQTEVDTYLSGLLEAIIVKPFDVWKLLKELSEAMPYYHWWDERDQEIKLTALKAPPTSADILDMDGNLVKNSTRITDKTSMRVSTVFINFGQFDPTKKLDEIGNYQQTYARVDTDSIAKYKSSEVRTINSRWISNINKAAALQSAALIGRRFANIPREIQFSLDAKDSDVWAGQSRDINHRDIVDFSGTPIDTTFQIISVKEAKNYEYTGLEYVYGDELPEDEGGGDPDVDLVVFGSSITDTNLRTVYDSLFPAPDATTQVKFIVESGVIIGGSVLAAAAMDTGSWPAGAVVTLQINSGGYVIGRGGKGRHATSTPAAEAGSLAIDLNYDITLTNNGVIGGGGGGGGAVETPSGTPTSFAAGGGGAGGDVGAAGVGTTTSLGFGATATQAVNGTTENGGAGGKITQIFQLIRGGQGGSLGAVGETGVDVIGGGTTSAGGAAGKAVTLNGNTITYDVTGTIHGVVS